MRACMKELVIDNKNWTLELTWPPQQIFHLSKEACIYDIWYTAAKQTKEFNMPFLDEGQLRSCKLHCQHHRKWILGWTQPFGAFGRVHGVLNALNCEERLHLFPTRQLLHLQHISLPSCPFCCLALLALLVVTLEQRRLCRKHSKTWIMLRAWLINCVLWDHLQLTTIINYRLCNQQSTVPVCPCSDNMAQYGSSIEYCTILCPMSWAASVSGCHTDGHLHCLLINLDLLLLLCGLTSLMRFSLVLTLSTLGRSIRSQAPKHII